MGACISSSGRYVDAKLLLTLAGCLINSEVYEARKEALTDHDGDSFAQEDDCDDADPAVFPGATEVCDGADQDCDGEVDEDAEGSGSWYPDADGDGYGDSNSAGVAACVAPDGHVENAADCDDAAPHVSPTSEEIAYDGVDDDCDGSDLTDVDGDGSEGRAAGGDDCDDDAPSIYPDAEERWADDGIDNDCDGDMHDPVVWAAGEARTRIDGVAPGGEFGRSMAFWSEGNCLFVNAPYVDSAMGAVYAVTGSDGIISAGDGGRASGTGPGVFLSARVGASAAGRVAVAQVSDRDGEGTVFVLDGADLCAGAIGAVDTLATLTIEGRTSEAWFGS